jgi:hypothetical protein
MKKCRKCGMFKHRRDFYKSKKSDDGLGVYCKDCLCVKKRKCAKCGTVRKIYSRSKSLCFQCYKKLHKPTKKCSVCGEWSFLAVKDPPTCFSCYDKYNRIGVCNRCGRKTKIKLKNGVCQFCYHTSRKEKCDFCDKINRIAKKTERGKMCILCYDKLPENIARRFNKNHEASITSTQWKALMDDFDWKCFYCGKALYDKECRTVDHIIPKCKNGSNSICNLVPCCRCCNGSKGYKDLCIWAKEVGLDYKKLQFLKLRIQEKDFDHGKLKKPGRLTKKLQA